MSKEPNNLGESQPDTSYNKYSPAKTHHSDRHIRNKIQAFIKYHDDNGNVMAGPIFTTEEVGQMLKKAVVTINKEAREIDAGMVKGISRFYTQNDIIKLHESFEQKRKPKHRKKSVLQETISWTLFQEVKLLREEHQRLIILVGDVFDSITKRLEELEK